MNVMNSIADGKEQIIDKSKMDNRCPFILVYHLAETIVSENEQQKSSIDHDETKNQNDEEPMECTNDRFNEERDKDDDCSYEAALLCMF
jgi:hypothetical protein